MTRIERGLNVATIVLIYAVTATLIACGQLTPFAAVVAIVLPRGVRAVLILSRARPATPPEDYVGWPLWYHRVCLEHNRLFGWIYILGLAAGAAWPAARI